MILGTNRRATVSRDHYSLEHILLKRSSILTLSQTKRSFVKDNYVMIEADVCFQLASLVNILKMVLIKEHNVEGWTYCLVSLLHLGHRCNTILLP